MAGPNDDGSTLGPADAAAPDLGTRAETPAAKGVAEKLGSAETLSGDTRLGAVFGRYRILRVLGRGGMGAVYDAEDSLIGRRVAIKFLPDEVVKAPVALKRFLGEAHAAGRLNHPNVV